MNARLKNSNEDEGKRGNTIPDGESNKHYAAMLKKAEAARKRSEQQERSFWHRHKWTAWRYKTMTTPENQETSPATNYQHYLQELENTKTVLLPPPPATSFTTIPETPALDVSTDITKIEPTWDPAAFLLDIAKIAELHCSTVPEATPRRRITVQLEYEDEPHVLKYVNPDLNARQLVETAIEQYVRGYNMLPRLLYLSPSTLLRMDPRTYWTVQEHTFYQSLHYGVCAVQIDITLDHETVQCN